jgi:hypothetical protein
MEFQGPTGEEQVGLLSDALGEVVAVFRRLEGPSRERLLKTIATLFAINLVEAHQAGPRTVTFAEPVERFSKEQSLSPKEFLIKKQPQSDVERVACLGYYLAHYRDQQHFNTRDISSLNTEAAQRRFANAANAVGNATQYGYLVPGVKGMKQLSAGGEMYVESLPDREAATAALANSRPRRAAKNQSPRKKAAD